MSQIALAMDILARDKASKTLRDVGKESGRTHSSLGKLAKIGGAALAGVGIAALAFGKKSMNAFQTVGRETGKLQRYIGGSVEAASRLRFAAKQSGVGVDVLAGGLGKFSRSLENARDKTKTMAYRVDVATGAWKRQTTIVRDAAGHFQTVTKMVPVTKIQMLSRSITIANPMIAKLGFAVRDAAGHLLPMSVLLPKVADKFASMPNGTEKTALALQLFGKSGMELLPFLNKGAKGIAELAKQSDKLGLTMSGKDMAAIKENAAAHKAFSAAVDGLQVSVGRQLFPVMAKFATFLTATGVPALGALSGVLTRTLRPAMSWLAGFLDKTTPKVASFFEGFTGSSVDVKIKPNFLATPGKNKVNAGLLADAGPTTAASSKFANFGAEVKRAFDKIRHAIVAEVVPAFTDFVKKAKDLGLQIASAVTPPLLALGDALMRNARFAVPLTAALVAIKGVMMAYEGVTSSVRLAQEAWTSATKIAAGVQRFFFTTTVAATGAQRASTISMIADRAAKIGSAVATKSLAAAQWVLNAAMRANPIGLVVTAIAGLVAGLIYAYKHCQTFRNIVDGAFKAISTAASFMWNNVLKPVFKLWLNAWFTVVGALVNGAASAFGWVPGLGGKLKKAAAAFNKFRDDVNRSLDGVTKTVSINVKANFFGPTRPGAINAGLRAAGGPVTAGRPYIVGEHEPELFVPNVSGQILNGRQMRSGGGRAGEEVMQVNLILDGQVIHAALLRRKRQTGQELGLA